MRILWNNYGMRIKMPARIIAAGLCVMLGAAAPTAALALRETGSTLLLPLMSLWVQAYQRAHTDVAISVEGTGSGQGISQAMAGTVDIGASDAYLSDQQLSDGAMLNIPLAVSAQVIAYNVQEIGDQHLNLSGDILADIYSGKIAFWDDPRIRAINPHIANDLPHAAIVPIRRVEGSGDTSMFTEYLSKTSKGWTAGYGTTIEWPKNDAMVKARGNSGMVDMCSKLDNSIAYIAVSYVPQLSFGDLGYAALRARDGSYVLPTPESLSAAVASAKIASDGRASLIDRTGPGAYPIVTYEYAIVRKSQPDAARAQALKNFFAWAISPNGGNDEARFLSALDFVPLPPDARDVSEKLIGEIH
jgi:phosphate transport system substrate-binding protein